MEKINVDAPKNAMKLMLHEHIGEQGRPAYTRVIDPKTGKHIEVMERVIEYTCPVCKLTQRAPTVEGVEYACPKCDWRYKIYHPNMLVLWNPAKVGVATKSVAPGETPPEYTMDRGHAATDPEEVDAEMSRTKQAFVGAIANREEKSFGNKTQIQVPADVKKKGGGAR